MLNVNKLLVTQKRIRDFEQLKNMIQFVQSGGFFTPNCLNKHQSRGKTSPLIEITLFEDGKHFIHDGHHRAASILLGGRDFIDTTEYRIRNFNYEDYLNPNLSASWWTPFDPRLSVRLADMTEYKKIINQLIKQNVTQEIILKYIKENEHLYVEDRCKILTLYDFVGSI